MSNETTISVSGRNRNQIDQIFEIFDDKWEDARLKTPAAAEGEDLAAEKEAKVPTETSSHDESTKQQTSSFTVEKTLPPCLVSLDLLNRIESYFKKSLPGIVNLPAEAISNSFSISITEKLGTHTFSTTAAYGLPMFSNGTSEIQCGVVIYYPQRLDISLRFSKQRILTELSVTLSSQDPRSIASAITEAIFRILQPQNTYNNIFHPKLELVVGLWFTAGLLFFGALGLRYPASNLCLACLFGLAFYAFIAVPLKPYSEFDSATYRTRAQWIDWFIFGSISFLLFGTLFPMIRKALTGL